MNSPSITLPEMVLARKAHQPQLRVSMVASSLARAGAEKQFVYIARALRESGADVRVLYFGKGGFYEKALREAGIHVRDLSNPGRPLRILWGMIHAERAFRSDIMIASQLGDSIHAGVSGRLSGALILAGVRSDVLCELNQYSRRLWLMRRIPHALVANSHNGRANLLSLGVHRRKVQLLPNVIDLEHFDEQSAREVDFPVPPSRWVVAAVGRLHSADKRFDRVLAAVAALKNRVPHVTALIVGRDRGAKASLEVQAKELGIGREHLIFAGECDNVPALLRQCHLLLLTSDYEGFPNVILEAMAARLPVITTPAGDAPRIVENGRTGYVVDFNDIQGMAERIFRLSQLDALRRQLGEAGRKRVERHYDFRCLPGRLFGIFCQVAAEQGRTALLANLRRMTDLPGAPRDEPALSAEGA